MRRLPLRADLDRGETLLELLIAIMVLGLCVVAVGGGIATSITISAVHRSQASAQAALHNYAETLESSYTACSAASPADNNYTGKLSVTPGFAVARVQVQYWTPPSGPNSSWAFAAACPNPDTGLQQVTLTLVSTSTNVSESLVVDLRSSS